MKHKKRYKYGDCIPESRRVYEKLKQKGYNPIMVEGWVEVNRDNDILPDEYFLMTSCPDEFARLEDINYNDYTKVLQHTWVEVNGHKIDITKNQFNIYGGIEEYIVYKKYDISNFGFVKYKKVSCVGLDKSKVI